MSRSIHVIAVITVLLGHDECNILNDAQSGCRVNAFCHVLIERYLCSWACVLLSTISCSMGIYFYFVNNMLSGHQKFIILNEALRAYIIHGIS